MDESLTPTAVPTPRESQTSLNAYYQGGLAVSAQTSRGETLAESNERPPKGEHDIEKGLINLSKQQNDEKSDGDRTTIEVQDLIDESKSLTGSRLAFLLW